MKISEQGINLIKHFESLRLEAYQCPAGVWTIGYGHTRTAHQGLIITEKQAIELLKTDIMIFEAQVNKLRLELKQNQYDAIVSFVFNLGIGTFKSSTLLKKIKVNSNDLDIAAQFVRFIKSAGKKERGLLLRRLTEASLYFSK